MARPRRVVVSYSMYFNGPREIAREERLRACVMPSGSPSLLSPVGVPLVISQRVGLWIALLHV